MIHNAQKVNVSIIFCFYISLAIYLRSVIIHNDELSPYAIVSNSHHYVKIGFAMLHENAPELISNVVQQNTRNLAQPHLQYPLFATIPTPPMNSAINSIMEDRLDVVDERNGKTFFFVDTKWDFVSASALVPHIRVDTNVTDEFHAIPSPYTSSYFEKLQEDHKVPTYPKVSPSYSCIRNLEGSYMTMENLQTQYPDLVDIIDIGPTYLKSKGEGGHEMKILKMTNKNSDASKKAPYFLTCSIHAREAVPAEICARFAEHILKHYGESADETWMLDYNEIHMLMQANPDGREDDEAQYASLGRGYCRRKNVHKEKRCLFDNGSKYGVDLNRNFPHREWGTTGTGVTCGSKYAGVSKASEPETQNIINYMNSEIAGINVKENGDFTHESTGLVIDLHSYGHFFVWPDVYSSDDYSTKDKELGALAYKLDSFSKFNFSASNDFAISGSLLDWSHDRFGISAIAIEFGTDFYQDCDDVEDSIIGEAIDMLLYGTRIAMRPYKYPVGPDIVNFTFSSSRLLQSDSLLVNLNISDAARVRDEDYSTGNQPISDLKVYIDSHPYEESSVDYELYTNLTFDDTVQTIVNLNISVSDLEYGQHILYAQAYDTQGPGPVFAKFFHILPDEDDL